MYRLNMDKSTYVGQYASRKRLLKKMDNSNKHKLRTLHVQLGTLLNSRKALNSKVTTRHFDQLREAVDAESDPYEIKLRLSRLEQSLKHEGLYKNVKSDFVHLRKDILGLLHGSENTQLQRHTLPGISHPAKDRTFYIAPKNDNDQSAASGASSSHKHAQGPSTDDMRMLNTAIGKLYRHLQLSAKEQETTMVADITHKEGTIQKENVNILTLSQMQPDETFHDIVLKLRNFEKEFQRQKVQQQREQMRLLEEIKRLNKNSSELRRENERIKGVQPILTKAKGKQVERIEERYRTEKKDMEEKIIELESGMKKNLAILLRDKEEVRSHIRSDVESLMSSINNLHYMVLGHYHDTPATHRNSDDAEILPTKDLLNMLTSVAGGVQILKTKSQDYSRQADDMSSWRRSFKELEREIFKFCRGFADDDDNHEFTTMAHETDTQMIVHSCKTKLQKTKENINTKLKNYADTSSSVKRKDREVNNYRQCLEELQSEIAKLHDQVISVQIQDISISMPEFERRQDAGDKSDGSADELPEADRQEQMDFLDKLKQIGTMVTHFQQLIIDRTSILNKMENDMLPLKIRVNRLHEEITKAMNAGGSPDHDAADDTFQPKRSFSPDGPHNVFSREIGNMLKKLSKMELAIRHLLESYATTHGRASI
ncbi:uncharacterized protein LOC123557595 isoform X1 [Mercenaria mercenaria]|uniref:uncharacterized protein LOC123557595 isoform X1 n=1 Tax=Mercenaria mercenaria TaxID=6596 RepID=UPI001E1DD5C0|nr:uncharacterized protein LOC123557595 isoform X1 [Mercenaria mercenaria]